jgi:hypothetical protein
VDTFTRKQLYKSITCIYALHLFILTAILCNWLIFDNGFLFPLLYYWSVNEKGTSETHSILLVKWCVLSRQALWLHKKLQFSSSYNIPLTFVVTKRFMRLALLERKKYKAVAKQLQVTTEPSSNMTDKSSLITAIYIS